MNLKNRKRYFFSTYLVIGFIFILNDPVSAKSNFLSTMNDLYKTSGTILDDCTVCHPNNDYKSFDSFGDDFRIEYQNNGKNATTAFQTIEPLDSDGDSYSNLDELAAKTFPGNPESFPELVPPVCTDNDSDGFSPDGGDCGPVDTDDNDSGIIPKMVGLTLNGSWFLDTNGDGRWEEGVDSQFSYGTSEDTPLMGDWDGDGIVTPGVKRGGVFYLRNSNTSGVADIVFYFGNSSDTPIVGDWNGDGIDTIGVKRGNTFFLRNSNTSGVADIMFSYGNSTDLPICGDWNGDGIDTIGVKREGIYHLRNSNSAGIADISVIYGKAGDIPVVGDWDNNGIESVGVYRPSDGNFYLKNGFDNGTADLMREFNIVNGTPLTGK